MRIDNIKAYTQKSVRANKIVKQNKLSNQSFKNANQINFLYYKPMNISFGNSVDANYSGLEYMPSIVEISPEAQNAELLSPKAYDDFSKTLAILTASNNQVDVIHEKNSNANLIAFNFATQVANNQFSSVYAPDAKVVLVDFKQAATEANPDYSDSLSKAENELLEIKKEVVSKPYGEDLAFALIEFLTSRAGLESINDTLDDLKEAEENTDPDTISIDNLISQTTIEQQKSQRQFDEAVNSYNDIIEEFKKANPESIDLPQKLYDKQIELDEEKEGLNIKSQPLSFKEIHGRVRNIINNDQAIIFIKNPDAADKDISVFQSLGTVVTLTDKASYDADMREQLKASEERPVANTPVLDAPGLNDGDVAEICGSKPYKKIILDDINLNEFDITAQAIEEAARLTSDMKNDPVDNTMELLKSSIVEKKILNFDSTEILDKDVKKTYFRLQDAAHIEPPKMGPFGPEKDIKIKVKVQKNSKIELDDVGGISHIKDKIRNEIIKYIKDPQKFKNAGVTEEPKGILLYGPTGTGKSLLAQAIAGESKKPFIEISAADLLNEYQGSGAANVNEIFSKTVDAAKKDSDKTAILFVDEFDSLSSNRASETTTDERTQMVNKFLTELQNVNERENVNVIVIGATNHRDKLDDASIRAGRFNYEFPISGPQRDKKARKEILTIHSVGKTFQYGDNPPVKVEKDAYSRGDFKLKPQYASVDNILDEFAQVCDRLSGAEIKLCLNKAAIKALIENRPAITYNDLVECMLEVEEGMTKEYNMPDWKFYDTVSHELTHGIMAKTLRDIAKEQGKDWQIPSTLSFITFSPRGDFGGAAYWNHQENPTMSIQSAIGSVACSLGPYCANNQGVGITGINSSMWGSRADLRNSIEQAEEAIEVGLGPNTKYIVPVTDFTKKMQEKNVAKDTMLIMNTGAHIANLSVKFFADFIAEYTNEFKDKHEKGLGGDNLSAKEFNKRVNKWINEDPKRVKQYNKLKIQIIKTLDNAQKGNDPTRNTLSRY